MSCTDIQELTVPYLELDLEPERVHQITIHLEACSACRSEMEAVRQVLVRVKGRAVPDPGQRFWDNFPSAVRRELRKGQAELGEPVRVANTPRWRSPWSLALAASVMLVIGTWLLLGHQGFELTKTNTSVLKGEMTQTANTAPDLPDLAEADWDKVLDEDDPDMALMDLAAGLDPATVDRLFKDI